MKSSVFKVVVTGDGGVGKSSSVRRYCGEAFTEEYMMTIGANFVAKDVKLDEYPNHFIKLQLWDLAGQKHFSFVRPPFYMGASGIVYTFDLTRSSSFQNISEWKIEAEKVVGKEVPSILIGNKSDLYDQRQIQFFEGMQLKDQIGAVAYYETSAKENTNIDSAYRDLTLAILRKANKSSPF